jgi:hypothetical protein
MLVLFAIVPWTDAQDRCTGLGHLFQHCVVALHQGFWQPSACINTYAHICAVYNSCCVCLLHMLLCMCSVLNACCMSVDRRTAWHPSPWGVHFGWPLGYPSPLQVYIKWMACYTT